MRTEISGIEFESCIWNASGVWGTSVEEIEQLAELSPDECGAIVLKSATKDARVGNPNPRVFVNNSFKNESIISVGLANHGWDYYIDAVNTLPALAERPVFISEGGLAHGDDLDEFIQKVNLIERNDVLVEFNFSCPNVRGHIQPGYDFDAFSERINFIAPRIEKPWGLKLPPYHDAAQIKAVARRFLLPAALNGLGFITVCNSMGGGLAIDTFSNRTLIAPNHGIGGIGGHPLKAIALGNVWSFYRQLPSSVKIIGCGGVADGVDALDMILAGASAVEVGSAIYSNCRILRDIQNTFETATWKVTNQVPSIELLRGTLQIRQPVTNNVGRL